MAKGENALVRWLQERFRDRPDCVEVGIGDDAAVLRLGGARIAITADMLLDEVHFDTRAHAYDLIGRKALACSLSDCAAMACFPRAATVSVALTDAMSLADVQHLYEGMAVIAGEFACAVVGGDTTSWSGPLAIDVAVVAEPMSQRGPILRSGARLGDAIYVTGPLGGSLLGKHLSFTPRIAEAARLAPLTGVHAMMDISDGLSMDLHRLCEASRCGAELETRLLDAVVSDAARELADRDGRPPLDHALADGEDFELLVVGEDGLARIESTLMPVGRITAAMPEGAPIHLVSGEGRKVPVEPRGFEHFR